MTDLAKDWKKRSFLILKKLLKISLRGNRINTFFCVTPENEAYAYALMKGENVINRKLLFME